MGTPIHALASAVLIASSSLAFAVNEAVPPVRPADPSPLLPEVAAPKSPAKLAATGQKTGETIGGVDKSTLKQMEQYHRAKAISTIAGKEGGAQSSESPANAPSLPPFSFGGASRAVAKPTMPVAGPASAPASAANTYYDPIDEFKVQSILIYGGVPLVEVRRGETVTEVRLGERLANWTVVRVTATDVWVSRRASVVKKVKVNGKEKQEIAEMPITRMLAPADHTVLRTGGIDPDKFAQHAGLAPGNVITLPAIPSDSTSIKPVKITK